MKTLLITLAIYYIGAIIAYFIAYKQIKRFKTNDSPLFSALLSWVTVAFYIVVLIIRLFKHRVK